MRRKRKKQKRQIKIFIGLTICFLLIMTVGYAAFQTTLTLNAKGSIKDKSRIIQSWTSTSNEDFHTDYYKENIVSVTFLDNASVPSNATESWDVSEDEKGGVKAWVIPNNEDSTKYDLYIGAKDGVIANENSSFIFYSFSNLESISFNDNYDTSSAIIMRYMFAGGNNITTLDVSTIDNSNAINIEGMFTAWNAINNTWGNRSLVSIDGLDNFNTSKVTNMNDLFAGQPLTSINLSSFNTQNVTAMYHMFSGCGKLEILNLCGFDTNKVTNMKEMFHYISSLQHIYVGSNWTTENADITSMFTNSGVSSVTTGQC